MCGPVDEKMHLPSTKYWDVNLRLFHYDVTTTIPTINFWRVHFISKKNVFYMHETTSKYCKETLKTGSRPGLRSEKEIGPRFKDPRSTVCATMISCTSESTLAPLNFIDKFAKLLYLITYSTCYAFPFPPPM